MWFSLEQEGLGSLPGFSTPKSLKTNLNQESTLPTHFSLTALCHIVPRDIWQPWRCAAPRSRFISSPGTCHWHTTDVAIPFVHVPSPALLGQKLREDGLVFSVLREFPGYEQGVTESGCWLLVNWLINQLDVLFLSLFLFFFLFCEEQQIIIA